MRRGYPLAFAGMKIGLFGGSFDPAHEGHRHAAETAKARLGLDQVWWMLTPQNPLKPQSSALNKRMDSAQRIARGYHAIVTDIESRLGTKFTYQTLRILKRLYPGVHFTLIVGADNLSNFKRWKNWREVARAVPIAVVARPGGRVRNRLPPGWVFLHARHDLHSSTALRGRS
jgi:nicotinate-nucleotide adenylyltransferase